MLTKVTLFDAFERFSDGWRPKVAGDVDQMKVKLAKFAGEFAWQHHEIEDQVFLVVRGKIRIDLEDGAVELDPGEFVIVPRGVEHRPVALPDADILLFEVGTPVNTGIAAGDNRTDLEWMDSL